MPNIFTRLSDMPSGIRSFVVLNPDCSYTIVLNCRLNMEQNLLSYKHEIDHIMNGDYEKMCGADLIERVAHGMD